MNMETIEERLAARARERALVDAKKLCEELRKALPNLGALTVDARQVKTINPHQAEVTIDSWHLSQGLLKQIIENLSAKYLNEERTEFLRKVDDLDEIIGDRVNEAVQRG